MKYSFNIFTIFQNAFEKMSDGSGNYTNYFKTSIVFKHSQIKYALSQIKTKIEITTKCKCKVVHLQIQNWNLGLL